MSSCICQCNEALRSQTSLNSSVQGATSHPRSAPRSQCHLKYSRYRSVSRNSLGGSSWSTKRRHASPCRQNPPRSKSCGNSLPPQKRHPCRPMSNTGHPPNSRRCRNLIVVAAFNRDDQGDLQPALDPRQIRNENAAVRLDMQA